MVLTKGCKCDKFLPHATKEQHTLSDDRFVLTVPYVLLKSIYKFRGRLLHAVAAKTRETVWETSPFFIWLHGLPRCKTGGPGPLKIVSAEPSRHVYQLSDKIKTGNFFALHRLRGKLRR